MLRIILVVFLIMNIIAIFHAYKFTHFSDTVHTKTVANTLTTAQKVETLFFGIDNPRP